MSAAQEEFNELMRDKSHRAAHRDDENDESSDDYHTSRPSSRNKSREPDLDDDEDFDDATAVPLSRPSLSANRSTIPSIRFQANTGPKGVITDAQDFLDSRRVHRRQSAMRLGLGNGHAAQPQLQQSQQQRQKLRENDVEDEDEDDEEDDDDDDDGDDEFMLEWRQSRLRELQNGVRENMVRVSPSPGRRAGAYGGLVTVDGDGYLDAVDNSGSETVVVVYIYDDFSDVSDMLEDRCIRPLAAKHQDTRFVKMHYEDAAMEPAGVPALLAYRAGDKFAALVPLIDDFPDDADLNAVTLETVLRRHQVLK